ncbi:hypothetical protein CRP01_27525 [Flavilitoribacter nigricans DSM 23189 = NBRC 102662]|uniref:Uncharacterized protein n=1 Tax=Flavilitoribacter nigricans (strain ATCC 23147 / DSM 23189 / NBRC 102662 / NCIMB 1420 / SS-2) TaxID=1122177 RepID=A0A2D0N4L9_FLAN2|nr:hypothetical protein CRP01_27525 [Flavilitoribacter nigricans DSM 23189 = NBRC 102662]
MVAHELRKVIEPIRSNTESYVFLVTKAILQHSLVHFGHRLGKPDRTSGQKCIMPEKRVGLALTIWFRMADH